MTSLTNTSGSVVARFLYDPYGNVTFMNAAGTSPAAPVSWDYLFQGGRRDQVTGRVSFGARDYIPFEGKWAQRDPLGLAAGDNNIYAFVGNNPVAYSDPTGLYIGDKESEVDGGRPTPRPTSGNPGNNGYGDKWYNNDITDWVDPFAYLAQYGDSQGSLIGDGLGTAFLKDRASDAAMDKLAQDRQMGDFAANPHGSLPSMRSLQSREMARDLEDIGTMAKGAVAAAELASDVAGIISGGLALKRAVTRGATEVAGEALKAGACFAAGTPVRMAFGSKLIEEIQPGDLVLSRHESDPEAPLATARVVQTFVRHANLVDLTVGTQKIRTTAEHPFWVHGRGWTDVKDLVVGDQLLDLGGKWAVLSAIEDEQELTTVYNFEVEKLHTYFIGGEGWGISVWVHNKTKTEIAKQLGRAGEEAAGINAPKTGIKIPGSDRVRFPDGLTTTDLTEVKNVASQSYTQQLRDYSAYAKSNNLNFNLYVRPSTQLSGPLRNAIVRGEINLKLIPGTK